MGSRIEGLEKQHGSCAGEAATQIGHVISHTHWDREWRYPLWQMRWDLVAMMDQIIDVLEQGLYPAFLTDGQCVMIEDYLLIRPEMRPRIEALVRAGKLTIGPWYTLPDTFPIDFECFVRNLLKGRRVSDSLGGCMNIGYFSFGWGLPAQFPQLLAGFGIDVAITSKYIDPRRAKECEFSWRSPDGTQLLSTRLGKQARAGFYFFCHLGIVHGVPYWDDAYAYKPRQGRLPFHLADAEGCTEDYFLLEPPAGYTRQSINKEALDAAWELADDTLLPSDRFVMDGSDSSAPQPRLAEILRDFNTLDPGRQMVHSSLPAYVKLLNEKLDRAALRVFEGELRDGPAYNSSANALATRLYMKQLNKLVQNTLVRAAEPLLTVAWMLGAEYPKSMLDVAWRYLLLSHCHDSINGVTQDKTADDVVYRLNQAREIAQVMLNHAMGELIRRMDLADFEADDPLLVAFNPLPFPRRQVMRAFVDFPWEDDVDAFAIEDANGERRPTQPIARQEWTYPVVELHQRPMPYHTERHEFAFDPGELPAGGYKVFRAVPTANHKRNMKCWRPLYAVPPSLATAPNRLENDLIALSVNPNGSFDLHDKRLGTIHRGLGFFEDSGDAGDYWVRYEPQPNQSHTSQGAAARIWLREHGPLLATICSEVTLRLPARVDPAKNERGTEMRELTVLSELTVRADSPEVEIKISFDNQVEDHRLRVMFPTGLDAATHADAGGHCTVEHRPIRMPALEGEGLAYDCMQTQPHLHFLDISDGKRGLAFLNDCLTEYQVLDNAERTVALTLLRSVRNEICTEARSVGFFPTQHGGQCLGRRELHLAILPHAGSWREADVVGRSEAFNTPLRLVQTARHDGDLLPGGEASLLALEPAAVRLLALKRAEDRDTVIARIYNSTGEAASSVLRLFRQPCAAWLTNMNEDREKALTPKKDGSIHIEVGPHKIVTIELEFAIQK